MPFKPNGVVDVIYFVSNHDRHKDGITKDWSSVVITEKYAKFNLKKLNDDFPSTADKIDASLNQPANNAYSTNLLGSYFYFPTL